MSQSVVVLLVEDEGGWLLALGSEHRVRFKAQFANRSANRFSS